MLNTDQILSAAGDVDETLLSGSDQSQEGDSTKVDNSRESTASGNEVGVDGLVGDVNVAGVTGGVTGLANSGDVDAGNVAGNGVTDVVGGVTGTAMPEVGDVTNSLPVEDTLSPQGGDVMAPVDNTAEQVGATVGGVAGDLGLGLE